MTDTVSSTHGIHTLGLQVTKYKTLSLGKGRYYVNVSSIQTWKNDRKRPWPVWTHSYIPKSLRIDDPRVGARLYAAFLWQIFCFMLRHNSYKQQNELVLYSSPSRERGSSWLIGESCIIEWKFRCWEDMTARGICSTFRNTSSYEKDCVI
jgi:hypothetical protein